MYFCILIYYKIISITPKIDLSESLFQKYTMITVIEQIPDPIQFFGVFIMKQNT